jgi:hypothetical protein
MVCRLLLERDQQQQRIAEQQQRADDLYIENLRLQVELDRLKKWYYGPRADRLKSEGDLAQLLLNFAEAMDRKPVNPADLPPHAEPEEERMQECGSPGRTRAQAHPSPHFAPLFRDSSA